MRAVPLFFLAGLTLPAVVTAQPSPAGAASFACAKASTPTEKAICADPGLSKLDERLAAAYREALKALAGGDPDDGPAVQAVKTDQRAWLAERNGCGADAACLRTAHERRLAVLTYRPDPGAPSHADRFVGRFDHKRIVEVTALGLRDGRLAVAVSGADPVAGRWVCSFTGVGRVDSAGRLVVGTPGTDGEGLVVEAEGKSGIVLPDSDDNRAARMNWCGNGGTFLLSYARQK